MEPRDIFLVFQYEMTSEKINQQTSVQIEETYELLYHNYMEYIEQLGSKPNNIRATFDSCKLHKCLHRVFMP